MMPCAVQNRSGHLPEILWRIASDALVLISENFSTVINFNESAKSLFPTGFDDCLADLLPGDLGDLRQLDNMAESGSFALSLSSGRTCDAVLHRVQLTDGQAAWLLQVLPARIAANNVAEAPFPERKAVDYYQLIFDKHHDVKMLIEPRSGRIIDANEAASQYFGFERTEFCRMRIDEIGLGPADPIVRMFEAVLAGRETRFVFTRTSTSGDIRRLAVECVPLDLPQQPLLYAVIRDETELISSQETSRRLLEILEKTTDIVATYDSSGNLAYMNRAGRSLLGLPNEGPLPDAQFAIAPGLDVAEEGSVDPVLHVRHSDTWSGETTIEDSNGEIVPVSQVIITHRSDDGTVAYYSNILRDISAQKAVEYAVRHSEERFRALVEKSSDAIALIDANGAVLYDSRRCAARRRAPEKESIFDDIHPEDLPEFRQIFLRCLAKPGREVRFEFRCRHGDDWCWLSGVATNRLNEGAVKAIVVNYRDITERKSAELELQRQKDLLQSIIDYIPVMVFCLDAEGRLLLYNQEMERVFGWSSSDFSGGTVFAESFLDLRDCESFETAIKAPDGIWRNFRQRTRGGRLIETTWVTSRLSDQSRIAFGQDITRRRQLEEQLRQASKMEAVGQLAGGIAHDFNNLLTVILGNAELAILDARERFGASAQLQSLTAIQTSARRGVDLTRKLLGFSRRVPLKLETVRLCGLVRETVGMLEGPLGNKIRVIVDLEDNSWPVEADVGQIGVMLMNLCLNSRDAIVDEGTIRISVANVSRPFDPADPQAHRRTGDFVRLRVEDDGIGIPPEHLPRVFEPFFTTKGPNKGTGLGLSLVHGIVEQHEGFVEIASEVGRGASIDVYLPRSPVRDAPVEFKEPASARPQTILLADDDPLVRSLAAAVLRKNGFHVLLAEDGTEVLRLFAEHRPSIDLVILDLMMPKLSGAETLRELKVWDQSLPVLLMSGYAGDLLTEEIKLLACGILNKPYLPRELVSAVRSAVGPGVLAT